MWQRGVVLGLVALGGLSATPLGGGAMTRLDAIRGRLKIVNHPATVDAWKLYLATSEDAAWLVTMVSTAQPILSQLFGMAQAYHRHDDCECDKLFAEASLFLARLEEPE